MSSPMVRRDDNSPRVFPPPGPQAADATPPALKALRDAELPRWAPYSTWRLDEPQRFARLWRHQQAAVEAELAGRWREADFFWGLVYEQFDDIAQDTSFWHAVADALGPTGKIETGELRRRFVNEVLIDAHCALYNGYAAHGDPRASERGAVHFNFIKRLLDLGTLTEGQRSGMARALAVGEMEAGEKGQNYEQAIAGCELLLKQRPADEDLQARLALLRYGRTLKKLSEEPALSQDDPYLETLQDGIGRLGDLERLYPYNLTIHELMARLYNLEARKLGKMSKGARALLAVERALSHSPALADAWVTREGLARWMQEVLERRNEIELDYFRRLTAAQEANTEVDLSDHLVHQVNEGFESAARYAQSSGAEKVREAYYRARDYYLWREAGLPVEQREELAALFWDAVSHVAEGQPADEAGVARAWDEVVAQAPELAALDRQRVLSFFARHLLGRAAEPAVRAGEPREEGDAPRLPVKTAAAARDGEPFRYWLFTPRDLRVKLQAAAAILLLVSAGVLGAREFLASRSRDAAFQRMITAVDRREYADVLDGAETFLESAPLRGADGREGQVRQLYSEAVVRWVAELPGELKSEDLSRLENYKRLMNEDLLRLERSERLRNEEKKTGGAK